jgi:Alternative splicing regulator/Surp module
MSSRSEPWRERDRPDSTSEHGLPRSVLERLFVQGYACDIYRNDAQASQLDEGSHLRALAGAHGSQPLLLDRYDARWALDSEDLSSRPAADEYLEHSGDAGDGRQAAQYEPGVDNDLLYEYRYGEATGGDHSEQRSGLGKYAPQGSHVQGHGWLSDGPSLNAAHGAGHYGPNAARPDSQSAAGFAAIGFNYSADGDEGWEGQQQQEEEEEYDDSGVEPEDKYDVFEAPYALPDDVVPPRSLKQHVIMLGTARTAQKSPQLEVLLKVKQSGSASFRFLAQHHALHAFYKHLKSWSADVLTQEYAKWQAVQTNRAKDKLSDEAVADEGSGRTEPALQLLSFTYDLAQCYRLCCSGVVTSFLACQKLRCCALHAQLASS